MPDTNTTTTSTAASPSKDEALILQNASEPSSPNTTTATATPPPPSASPSPSITEENNTKLLQSHELLQALATQMQYYFSPHNLSQDTYLNTIMKLNSGFVPITILCGFTNINRIIARYANALANGMNIADIDVHHLLVCSAVHAKVLKIILLDQDGNVIKTHGEEGYDEMKGPKAFEAIGTDDEEGIDADGDGEGVSHAKTAVVKEKDRADANANLDAKSSSTNSTVILRDVPEEATEDDIRHVFEGDDGNVIIHNVQKEVGHCWFVTIDASTSQQDLVSILLGLRSKTICNEPIKARLKTQSTATQGTPMQGPGYNPHRSRQVYAGDRMSYSKKINNSSTAGTKTFSKPRVGKVGDYPGSGPYKGNNYDPSKNNVKPVEKAGPPPPLVEEHFPGLAGSPKSVSVSADASASGESEAVGVPVAVKKEIVHASGYAAALKKAAPPVMEVSTENVKRTMPKPKSPARKVADAKSTGTVSTEGSIADDKSHASKETDVASFPAVKSWGGGRSFADILKTQEA